MTRGSPPPCKREPSPCQNSKTNTETNFQLGTQSSEAVKAPSSEIPGLSQAPPLTGEEISHPSPHLNRARTETLFSQAREFEHLVL